MKILSGRSTASNGPIRSTNIQWGMQRKPPLNKVSLYSEDDEFLLAFELISQPDGTQVTVNMEGLDESLENLKAFLAGKELPYA